MAPNWPGRRPKIDMTGPLPPMSGPPDVSDLVYTRRRNPWPYAAGGLVLAALIATVIGWKLDTSSPPPITDVTVDGDNGFTPADVRACSSFDATSSQAVKLLRSAGSPEGRTLAAAGLLTEDVLDGYLSALNAIESRIDDDELKELVTTTRTALEAELAAAIADETAGTPSWTTRFATVQATTAEFAAPFQKRCEDGGVMISIVVDD